MLERKTPFVFWNILLLKFIFTWPEYGFDIVRTDSNNYEVISNNSQF